MCTQTDAFLSRPASPVYVPAKLGVDAATEILDGELFDFDREVPTSFLRYPPRAGSLPIKSAIAPAANIVQSCAQVVTMSHATDTAQPRHSLLYNVQCRQHCTFMPLAAMSHAAKMYNHATQVVTKYRTVQSCNSTLYIVQPCIIDMWVALVLTRERCDENVPTVRDVRRNHSGTSHHDVDHACVHTHRQTNIYGVGGGHVGPWQSQGPSSVTPLDYVL